MDTLLPIVGTTMLFMLTSMLGACSDPGFSLFEEIDGPRVLAITSDLAEAFPGETVTFAAVVAGDPEAATEHHWEACGTTEGPNAYFACSEGDGGPLIAVDGPEFQLPLMITEEDLAGFCEALAELDVPFGTPLPDCDAGLPLTIRLTSDLPDGSQQISIRTINVRPTELLDQRNVSPGIVGLSIAEDVLTPDGTTTVPLVAEELELVASIAEDAMEAYLVGDEALTEVLELSWFSTHGELDLATTFLSEGLPESELYENSLTLSEEDLTAITGGERFEIFLVLRDGRGGVSAMHFQMEM